MIAKFTGAYMTRLQKKTTYGKSWCQEIELVIFVRLNIKMIIYYSACGDWRQTGLILGLHPGNERRRYNVTPSLIGWGQT